MIIPTVNKHKCISKFHYGNCHNEITSRSLRQIGSVAAGRGFVKAAGSESADSTQSKSATAISCSSRHSNQNAAARRGDGADVTVIDGSC